MNKNKHMGVAVVAATIQEIPLMSHDIIVQSITLQFS